MTSIFIFIEPNKKDWELKGRSFPLKPQPMQVGLNLLPGREHGAAFKRVLAGDPVGRGTERGTSCKRYTTKSHGGFRGDGSCTRKSEYVSKKEKEKNKIPNERKNRKCSGI